jgi:hypothetical protein
MATALQLPRSKSNLQFGTDPRTISKVVIFKGKYWARQHPTSERDSKPQEQQHDAAPARPNLIALHSFASPRCPTLK